MEQASIYDYQLLMSEVSRRMAASQLSRRQSRSSSAYSTSTSRRATRIEKPRSIHNSPRAVERRRTVTAAFKRYSTADLNLEDLNGLSENHFEQPWGFEFPQSARPVSWHPSSTQFSAFQTPMEESAPIYQIDEWSSNQATSEQLNNLGDQLNYFANYQPYFPGQDHDSASLYQVNQVADESAMLNGFMDSEVATPSVQESYLLSVYGINPYQSEETNAEPWPMPDWAPFGKVQSQEMIRPISSDSLPLQHPPSNEDTVVVPNDGLDADEENELVGMGLYDPPEANTSWLITGTSLAQGKGLKLEETWQPPESSDEDSEEEGDDDGETEAEEEEEESEEAEEESEEERNDGYVTGYPEKSDGLTVKDPHQVWTVPQVTPNMTGQSFYFEEDHTTTDISWYQDYRDMNAPVARINSSWL